MSGRLIELQGGKVPQRAIRYLNRLPYVVSYHLSEDVTTIPGVDFGAGDYASIIKTPALLRAKPMDVSVYKVTETFNAVTTAARVDIGDGTDADEFAYTGGFGTLATTTALNFSAHAGTLLVGDTEIVEPADDVTVTCVAPTGGTPAGRAMVAVSFLYFE
jgi:hypothetical protein